MKVKLTLHSVLKKEKKKKVGGRERKGAAASSGQVNSVCTVSA